MRFMCVSNMRTREGKARNTLFGKSYEKKLFVFCIYTTFEHILSTCGNRNHTAGRKDLCGMAVNMIKYYVVVLLLGGCVGVMLKEIKFFNCTLETRKSFCFG